MQTIKLKAQEGFHKWLENKESCDAYMYFIMLKDLIENTEGIDDIKSDLIGEVNICMIYILLSYTEGKDVEEDFLEAIIDIYSLIDNGVKLYPHVVFTSKNYNMFRYFDLYRR